VVHRGSLLLEHAVFVLKTYFRFDYQNDRKAGKNGKPESYKQKRTLGFHAKRACSIDK
jgi:hypothetical protein